MTIEALLVDIDALLDADDGGELRARLARLVAASVVLGLLSERGVGDLGGTIDALRLGPGPVLLATEAGAQLYDLGASGVRRRRTHHGPGGNRESRRFECWKLLLSELGARGIPVTSVLLLGHDQLSHPEVRGVHPSHAAATLDEQLEQRARKRVPTLAIDPEWAVIDEATTHHRPGAQAAVFTVGDGNVATRGVPEEDPGNASVLTSGTYIGTGPKQHLLSAPGWTALEFTHPTQSGEPARQRRVLDLRAGLLIREELVGDHPLRSVRFASAARSGVQALRAEAATDRLRAGTPLQAPAEGTVETGQEGDVVWVRSRSDVSGVTAVAVQDVVDTGPLRAVERLAAYRSGSDHVPEIEEAATALEEAARVGFDGLFAEHRAVWARRWATTDVEIPDDPAAQQAFRFAIFQLWSNVGCPVGPDGRWSGEERAVGARGLSGQGVRGSRFLGRRRVRAAGDGDDLPSRSPRDDRVPNPAAAPRPRPCGRRGQGRRPLPLGVRARR